MPTIARVLALARAADDGDLSRERYRRVGLTAGSTALARAISVASTLAIVPLALHHLGRDVYGLWLAITSVTVLSGIADLGLGNGLVNAIASAAARKDEREMRRQVASAGLVLLAIALTLGGAFAAAYGSVDWAALFNVSTPAAVGEAGPAVAVFVACLLALLPLTIVQRVQLGLQEAYVAGLWTAAGALAGFVGVVVAILAGAELRWIVLAQCGAPAVAALANGLALFLGSKRWLWPRRGDFALTAARALARAGGFFFVIQIAIAVAYESDALIVARILGTRAVPSYSVPMKLFAFAPMALGLVLAPLWPAYRDAAVRGDMPWIRSTLRRSLLLGVAVNLPAALALLLAGRWIVHVWVGDSVTPSTLLLAALTCWALLNAVGGPLAMLLNGLDAIGFQAACATAMMIANLGISIALTQALGVSGVVWGTVIAQLVFIFAPSAIAVPRLLRRVASSA